MAYFAAFLYWCLVCFLLSVNTVKTFFALRGPQQKIIFAQNL